MTKKNFLAVMGCAVMAGALLAGCGSTSGSGVYTLREFQSASPTNWNPHTWEMNNDTYIPSYCEMGLVDLAKKSGAEEYEFVYEMATNISDVTAEDDYQQSAFMTKWGVKAGQTGRVWKIDLNQSAKWEDGTVINADSYVASMKEDLDPAMQNYRAQVYYTGDIEIAGAHNYFNGAGDWDSVGLLKTGDYSLLYITANEVTPFYFKTNVTSNWLVYTSLYDSLKKTTGNLTATTYGTSASTYKSFGPYKLVSFEKDKQIKFARNDNWYGWKDGKHDGQYKTTNITCDIIPQHATALLSFQQGDLDSVDLEPADLSKYNQSDYILHTPETYTMRLVMDSNLEDLKKLEEGLTGVNKRILHQYDFRKAISLMIDRTRFNTEGTAGNVASYGLISDQYYYDIENDPASVYRNTMKPSPRLLICMASHTAILATNMRRLMKPTRLSPAAMLPRPKPL
jgi:ABC-type transport system substrate-binding protein